MAEAVIVSGPGMDLSNTILGLCELQAECVCRIIPTATMSCEGRGAVRAKDLELDRQSTADRGAVGSDS